MCTQCILSNFPVCNFRGWDENCEQCKTGKRPKCSFKVSVSQRMQTNDLLAAATRHSSFGKSTRLSFLSRANLILKDLPVRSTCSSQPIVVTRLQWLSLHKLKARSWRPLTTWPSNFNTCIVSRPGVPMIWILRRSRSLRNFSKASTIRPLLRIPTTPPIFYATSAFRCFKNPSIGPPQKQSKFIKLLSFPGWPINALALRKRSRFLPPLLLRLNVLVGRLLQPAKPPLLLSLPRPQRPRLYRSLPVLGGSLALFLAALIPLAVVFVLLFPVLRPVQARRIASVRGPINKRFPFLFQYVYQYRVSPLN